jgi:hypothetical protein
LRRLDLLVAPCSLPLSAHASPVRRFVSDSNRSRNKYPCRTERISGQLGKRENLLEKKMSSSPNIFEPSEKDEAVNKSIALEVKTFATKLTNERPLQRRQVCEVSC